VLDRKQLGRRMLELFFDYGARAVSPSAVRKAVIFTPESVGDAMATFPILRSLQRLEGVSISVVCSFRSRVVFEGESHLSSVYSVRHDRDYREVVRIARLIRESEGQIDVCFDCTASTSSAIYFIGTLRAFSNVTGNFSRMRALDSGLGASFIERRQLMSRPIWWGEAMVELGFPAVESHFEFPVSASILSAICLWLEPLPGWCVVNAEGAIPQRTLSLNSMRRLLQLIRAETDLAILLPSTPANINRSLTLCDEFKNVFVYQSQTSVAETAAMVRGARFVVSPDTAVVHIASAFNKPTLGFYLDDSPPWLPLASRQKVLLFEKTVNEEFDSAEITNFVRENC